MALARPLRALAALARRTHSWPPASSPCPSVAPPCPTAASPCPTAAPPCPKAAPPCPTAAPPCPSADPPCPGGPACPPRVACCAPPRGARPPCAPPPPAASLTCASDAPPQGRTASPACSKRDRAESCGAGGDRVALRLARARRARRRDYERDAAPRAPPGAPVAAPPACGPDRAPPPPRRVKLAPDDAARPRAPAAAPAQLVEGLTSRIMKTLNLGPRPADPATPATPAAPVATAPPVAPAAPEPATCPRRPCGEACAAAGAASRAGDYVPRRRLHSAARLELRVPRGAAAVRLAVTLDAADELPRAPAPAGASPPPAVRDLASSRGSRDSRLSKRVLQKQFAARRGPSGAAAGERSETLDPSRPPAACPCGAARPPRGAGVAGVTAAARRAPTSSPAPSSSIPS